MLTRQTRKGMSGIEILTISTTLLLLFVFAGSEMWHRTYKKDQKQRQAEERLVRESAEFREPLKNTVEIGPPEKHFTTGTIYRVWDLAIDNKTGRGLAWVGPEHGKRFATWHSDILNAELGQHFKFITRASDGEKVMTLVDLEEVGGGQNGEKTNVMAEDASK